jgi:3' exoribonuclease, RNase T-like
MPKPDVYISVDVEADGPVPALYSMLSLGAVALDLAGNPLGEFSVNLQTLEGAGTHPTTMAWWKTQGTAWAACRENPQDPHHAMRDFAAWLKGLPGQPVFVGYPASFDFMFVAWYLHRFVGENPFGWAALDMKSYAMAKLGVGFSESIKRKMPPAWFSTARQHRHIALEDAREQAELWVAMLRA